jgi:hypothetical protein
MEIAACSCDGISSGPGIEMKQRFLLYWIYGLTDKVSVNERIKSAVVILACLTNAFLTTVQQAVIGTQLALHTSIGELFVQPGFLHLFLRLTSARAGWSTRDLCPKTLVSTATSRKVDVSDVRSENIILIRELGANLVP